MLARYMFRLRRYDDITDALAILHWLRLPQRVDYKVAVIAFRVVECLFVCLSVRHTPVLYQLVKT